MSYADSDKLGTALPRSTDLWQSTRSIWRLSIPLRGLDLERLELSCRYACIQRVRNRCARNDCTGRDYATGRYRNSGQDCHATAQPHAGADRDWLTYSCSRALFFRPDQVGRSNKSHMVGYPDAVANGYGICGIKIAVSINEHVGSDSYRPIPRNAQPGKNESALSHTQSGPPKQEWSKSMRKEFNGRYRSNRLSRIRSFQSLSFGISCAFIPHIALTVDPHPLRPTRRLVMWTTRFALYARSTYRKR